ncbi:MAG: DUF4293 family protein [Balneolaceae bacterium]|nr:MAG: DUF4293 family protein [Balneolaceae bacterium]
MIQRPQTIYLLAAAIFNFAVFFTSLYSRAMADPVQWIGWGLAISLTLVVIVSIAAIFLYNNRKKQLTVVKTATYFQIIALAAVGGILFSLGGFGAYLLWEVAGTLFICLALLMLWLAGRGIKKDEDLVKSMDRIR